jgi:dinuclear metal center YbgI/SA1388 family protein
MTKKSRKHKQKSTGNIDRNTIVSFLDYELRTRDIKDVSCNGLQVEGDQTITKIGFAVDACMESYRKAAEQGCQMLIVHHGIIWDGLKSITAGTYEHVKYLIDNGLNLYASHLPLDLHPTFGNNACLASIVGLKKLKPFGLYKGINIGFEGEFTESKPLEKIVNFLCEKLSAQCTVLPFGSPDIKRAAIVSGGAAEELSEAIYKGVDLYITGESSHQNYHAALEARINVIYCGHYHSETTGVKALAALISEKFGTETVFIDIPTEI